MSLIDKLLWWHEPRYSVADLQHAYAQGRASVRGYIRVRTPDDVAPMWTAQGDLVLDHSYSYVSGNVVVLVDWTD